jgi:hypothetical protein
MIDYISLGGHKQLNEIVFAGSHDAGIIGGGANVKTQVLDIEGQAAAGVRLFDVRITGALVKKSDGGSVVSLKSYHGQGFESKKEAIDLRTGETGKVKVKTLLAGEFGLSLTKICTDAAKFVARNPSEFLILKFDHCSNWDMIAEACMDLLGNTIYKGGGNLNTKTLQDLSGKVVVAFASKGMAELNGRYGPQHGIVGIKNLKSGGSYDASYAGLQYFGKGGTDVSKPFKKVAQNVDNQGKLMKKGVGTDPQVMGMMYWTSTGVFESIEERNDTMWTKVKKEELKKLWTQGLYASIQERIGATLNGKAYSTGATLKAFMPNVVMIDFADEDKCKTIYGLNTVASVDLADVASVLNA